MIACIKTILLTLVLFLSCYSQQGGIGDMQVWLTGKSHGSGITMRITYDAGNNDTLKLKHNEKYVIFSGVFLNNPQESKFPGEKINIKSVIRGADTSNQRTISGFYLFKKDCPNKIYEKNKDYLVLGVTDGAIENDNIYMERNTKCNDILPDTPENREMLIQKYEGKVVIYK